LLSLFELYFPVRMVKFNKNYNCLEKWMSRGILVSRSNKIHLGKLAAKNPCIHNIEKFKKYRNLYNSIIRAA
jgi:hypothetical protein